MSRKMAASTATVRTTRPPPFDRRAAFVDRLSNRLRTGEFELVGAEFGRESGRAVWMLTLQLPNQHVLTLRAPLRDDVDTDPFDPKVCDDVANRVIHHLKQR